MVSLFAVESGLVAFLRRKPFVVQAETLRGKTAFLLPAPSHLQPQAPRLCLPHCSAKWPWSDQSAECCLDPWDTLWLSEPHSRTQGAGWVRV